MELNLNSTIKLNRGLSYQYSEEITKQPIITQQQLKNKFLLQKRIKNKKIKKSYNEFKEKQKKTKNNFGQFFNDAEDIICSICMDTIMYNQNTICGHTFCEKCLLESLIQKKECPLCRENLKNQTQVTCIGLEKILNHKIKQNIEKNPQYKKRVDEINKWKEERTLKEFKVGQQLDVQDTELIWCEAEIKKIEDDQLLISYIGWDELYNEFIKKDSPRLAPQGFFTQRNNIPKYILQDEQNNIYGRISTQEQEDEDNNEENIQHMNQHEQRFADQIRQILQDQFRLAAQNINNSNNDNNNN